MKYVIRGIASLTLLGFCWQTAGFARQALSVRTHKWLQVQTLTGQVTVTLSSQTRSAKRGDRLQAVGDTLTTGQKSSAQLLVDTAIGTVEVAENTQVQIQTLNMTADQGRITRLYVPYGRVRLKLRKFTSSNSRLEIQTPASINGVRGTEFGVNIQPDGKTGVAVLSGGVVSQAQNKNVPIPAKYQSFTVPGRPPAPAVPLREDTRLTYQLQKLLDGGIRRIRLVGQVDPVNTVTVDGRPLNTDANGRFSVVFQAPSYLKIQVVVTTPLGTEKRYDLAF